MKSCNHRHRWDLNFDSLSDEEFEELLEHTDACDYHARLLDKYNQSIIPLLRGKMPENILPVCSKKITLSSIWINLLSLKMQKAISSLNGFWRWRFTVGIFLLVTAAILLTSGGSLLIQPSIFISAIFALGLLILAFLPKIRVLNFANANEIPGITIVSFENYKDTSLSRVPEKHQPKNLTAEEKSISLELKKIILTGFTVDNCQKGLELLKKNEAIVRNSWMNTLNKARLLIGTGEREEARRIICFVMEVYSDSREAVGSACQAFSWLEEVEYNEGGKVDQQKLDCRMNYITKGLQFYPEYYQLLIDAFEVACLKKNADEAIVNLNKLIKVDKEIAKQYFMDNPMTEEMRRLSPKLKMKIAWLTKGKTIMKKLKSVKIRNLILRLGIALSLLTISPKDGGSVQLESAMSKRDGGAIQLIKVMPKKDGSSIQLVKAISKKDGSSVG